MGRRRRRDPDLDFAMAVAQVGAVLFVGAMFVPQVRETLLGIGMVLVSLVVLFVVVALGVWLIRRSARRSPLNSVGFEPPPMEILRSTMPGHPPRISIEPDKEARPPTPAELIERMRVIDWFQFEKMVALAYRKLGYTVTKRGGANPDGGIDLVIEKEGQRSAVQCKQWKTWNVGVKAVREFLGALTDAGIQHGIFITLRGYTGEARQLAEKHGIEILNETALAGMLASARLGAHPEVLAILCDTRKFCPKCECEMVLRTASRGPGAGKQFWGCSAYPRCRFTMRDN